MERPHGPMRDACADCQVHSRAAKSPAIASGCQSAFDPPRFYGSRARSAAGPRGRPASTPNLRRDPVAERSKYQQKIIKNYYDNREAISLQRLSELVTELYLAEGKARAQAMEEHSRRAGKAEDPAAADRAPGKAGQPVAGGQAGRRADGQEVTRRSPARWPPTTHKSPQLRWKKFPVLDDGFVCLVDVMGDDQAVVQAARVSYGEGTRKVSDDRGLIRYLLRHRHTTPFEMAEIKLLVRVPMDCWRQWIRHRTANVNEYSTRYSLAIDAMQTTAPDGWRTQAANNRQGSGDLLAADQGAELSAAEAEFQRAGRGALRAADRPGRGPRAGPQGPAAVDLHRGLLEDRPAQPAALPGAADGQPRAVGDSRVRHDDRRARSCGRCFRWCGRRLSTTAWQGLFLTRLDREVIVRLVSRLAAAGRAQATEEDFLAVQDPTWVSVTRSPRARRMPRQTPSTEPAAAERLPLTRRTAMSTSPEDELLDLNQQLLESIAAGDWETYQELCDPTLTAFEPEGRGPLDRGPGVSPLLFRPRSRRLAAHHDDVVAQGAADGRRGRGQLRAAGAVAR